MTQTTHRWADELKESVELLKTMRDEVKVQVHLGGMEVKDRFTALENRMELEQQSARNTFKELIAGYREVKAQLKQTNDFDGRS